MKYLWFSLGLFLLIACNRTNPDSLKKPEPGFSEYQSDSIFEAFEAVAYEHPELYVNNPDSFLNNLPKSPESPYQKQMYAYGLIFMGYELLQHGDNFESIKYYERAYDYVKSNKVEVDNINTELIKPIANLYIRINDTQKSIALLKTALKQTSVDHEIVGLSNNLANAYLYNSELDSAKNVLHQALIKPSNSLSKALLYNTLASAYGAQQHKKESIYYNNLAISNFEKNNLIGDTLLWYISAIALKGDLMQDNTYHDRAIELVKRRFPNDQNRLKAKLTLNKGNILFKKEAYNTALETYDQTLRYFSSQKKAYILDYTFTQALLGKANIFGQQSQIDSALYYYEWAIENDFRTQQLIVSPKDQLRNNILNKETIENLISLVLSNQNISRQTAVVQQLLWCIELSKARLLINEINRSEDWIGASEETKKGIQTIRGLYHQIDTSTDQNDKRKLSKRIQQVMIEFQLSEKYFETIRFEPQKADFLKQLNKPNSDFYTYFIHNDSSISIIHKSRQNLQFKRTTTAEPLARLLVFKDKYFGSSPNNYNRNPQEYNLEAQYLTEELLPNITDAQRNIFVSLDGQLYGFPFDALYNNDFLVKTHNFAYLNSFLLFDFLTAKPQTKSDIALMYRSVYPKPLPDLQFVQQEVQNIAKRYVVNKISPRKQTDTIIREQFARSNVIHIAAHTILDTTTAPIIYLDQPISTNQLRFYEMNTPLVFLSACNTGHGRPLPSEGTESIQRVFLSKNVPSVVSTFWFANDETMLNITTLFYKHLFENEDPISALAEAKRTYLKSVGSVQQNPWYWANINYTGIGNKVGLKKRSNLPYFIIGSLALLALAIQYPVRLWFYKTFENKDKKTCNKT